MIKVEEWCIKMRRYKDFVRIFSLSVVTTFFACTPRMGEKDVVSVDRQVFSAAEFFTEESETEFGAFPDSSRREAVARFAKRRIIFLESKKRGIPLKEAVAVQLAVLGDNAVVEKILEDEVWSQLMSDSSLRILYDRLGREIGLHHVVLTYEGSNRSVSDRTEEEAMNLIREIREKVVSGEMKFFEAAKEYSEDPARFNDGYVGQIKWGEFFEPLQSVAFSLDAGEISHPVRSNVGYHIVRVTGGKKISLPDYDEMLPQLQGFLRGGRGHEFKLELERFESKLRKIYAVRFNTDHVQQAYRELIKIHGDREGSPKVTEIPEMTANVVMCVAGGVPVDLNWFKARIVRFSPFLTSSIISSEETLVMSLEHILFRFLAQKYAEDNRDESWFQDAERLKKRREYELLMQKLLDELGRDDSESTPKELLDSVISRHAIRINEAFLKQPR